MSDSNTTSPSSAATASYNSQDSIFIPPPPTNSEESNASPVAAPTNPADPIPQTSAPLRCRRYFRTPLYRCPLSELTESQKECPICYSLLGECNAFGAFDYNGNAVADENSVETPVKLACGHVFGDRCFEEWIQGDAPGADACPVCRVKLHVLTVEEERGI